MLTRSEEKSILQGLFRKRKCCIAGIRITSFGAHVKLSESIGFIGVLSDIVGAPAEVTEFDFFLDRKKTDSEIYNEEIDSFYGMQADLEDESWSDLEDQVNDAYNDDYDNYQFDDYD